MPFKFFLIKLYKIKIKKNKKKIKLTDFKRILELIDTQVEKLPEKCKLIFKYSREQGMPAKEIARELHISQKTVENQLNKALRQLKLATRSFLNLF